MKRVLFVLFGIMAAMAMVGLTIAFTRPIKWPAGIGAPEWGKVVGEKAENLLEQALEGGQA